MSVKVDWVFLRLMGLVYAGGTALALFLAFRYGSEAWADSVLVGAGVSVLHFLAGFMAVEFAFDKSHTTFLKVVLGGMVIRLFVMTAVVVLLIKVLEYDPLSLLLSLLGYYILNLSFEIGFLQKKVSLKNQ